MHPFRIGSLRILFAAVLASVVLAGGLAVMFGASRHDLADSRAADSAIHRVAVEVSDRLAERLATVERVIALASENAALSGDGNAAQIQPFLGRLRAMNPGFGDVLLADRSGRVLATASGSSAGGDVSSTTWFTRGLSAVVIGDANDRARGASGEGPRNVIVAAPQRTGRETETGVLAVQLAPNWIEDVIAATRRALGPTARNAEIQILNAGGRAIYRSTVVAGELALHEATVSVADGAGLGWLVAVKGAGTLDDSAAIGSAASVVLGGAVLAAAFLGWLLGGWMDRSLRRVRHAALEDRSDLARVGVTVTEIAELAEAVGACVDRSQGRERLLRESRSALARSRDRVRAVRLLGGYTCWEVDLRNGKVTWGDEAANAIETASERSGNLEEVLSRIDGGDRRILRHAMQAACEEPGSVREAVVRTLVGDGDAVGRRLTLRLTAVASNGKPVRLHVLSRDIGLVALPAPTASGMPSPVPERPATFPAQAIVVGLTENIGDILGDATTTLATLYGTGEVAQSDAHRLETAMQGLSRCTDLNRRIATLVRADEIAIYRNDTAQMICEAVALVRIALLPGLTFELPQGELPALACSAHQIDAVLLNLALDTRVGLSDKDTIALSVECAAPSSSDANPGLRIVVTAPNGFRAGRGILSIRELMAGIDGSLDIVATDDTTVITMVFPVLDQDAARSAPKASAARTLLLVEPDGVLRAATAESLSSLGYRVTSAASSEEATAALAGQRDFSAMICAHAMPAINGALIAEVASRTHPTIDIVLMVADDRVPTASDAFRILHKPFGSQDLAQSLGDFADKGRRNAA